MEGVAEQNLVGLAAGMAMEGRIVYLNTIATFLTRRCYEQIAVDLCLHNANVRLIANGGGVVYAPLGPTHLAIEDIAILRRMPNMTILAPADAEEMARAVPVPRFDHPGPIYVRVAKGHDPIVTARDRRVPDRSRRCRCATGTMRSSSRPALACRFASRPPDNSPPRGIDATRAAHADGQAARYRSAGGRG